MHRTNGEIRLVSLQDTSLDLEKMAEIEGEDGRPIGLKIVERYATTRDEALVIGREGDLPLTWFTIRRLDVRAAEHALSASTETERNRRAFAAACTHISDLYATDGRVMTLTPSGSRTVDSVTIPVMSEADMSLIAVSYVQEIGAVAFTRAFLAPKGAISYPLPQCFSLMMSRQVASLAEREKDQRNHGQKPQAEEATQEPTEPPTNATAAPTITASIESRQ